MAAKSSTSFLGAKFRNPFILPSGIITDHHGYLKAVEAGVGGITLKSLTKERREGNPIPRVWRYDSGMINSVGLANSGIEKGCEEVKNILKEVTVPVIVSLFSTDVKEFCSLVERITPLKPDFIELNLSCPNVHDELGEPLGMECGAAGKIVRAVKKYSGKVPILAKLSPNVSNIADIAKSCEAEGADGIVAINTVGPGMIIDINRKVPVIGAKKGGVSGPGIFPVAVRCVYEIYEAVKIPIIGMGGVVKWQDVVELMLAGAQLVGVGTGTYIKGMDIYKDLDSGLIQYMEKNNFKTLSELTGLAHKN